MKSSLRNRPDEPVDTDRKKIQLKQEFESIRFSILESASKNFTISPQQISAQSVLEHFDLYMQQQRIRLHSSYRVAKGETGFDLFCVQIDSTFAGNSRRGKSVTQTHEFLYGLFQTKADFGSGLILPERFIDKVIELFARQEIDFEENKKFSSKYLCYSSDKGKFKKAFSLSLLDFLSTTENLQIEFKEKYCLFRTEKSIIDQKSSLQLFETGIRLKELIG